MAAKFLQTMQDYPPRQTLGAFNLSKIERELGWRPVLSFEAGLAETVQWYRDNVVWVEGVRSGDYLQYYERQYPSLREQPLAA